jgi:release factor glutamine methyltransferase
LTVPVTVRGAVDRAGSSLAEAGIPVARLEARLLVGHALGVGTETLVGEPERPLTADQQSRLEGLLKRRLWREPLAYILGNREFWSLPFRVSADTLVPRPESETLVEAALAWVGERRASAAELRILDLGTGSGCLLLALLSELPRAFWVGVDLSAATLAIARDNAEALGLGRRAAFVVGDWGDALAGGFDLVVANPPYVPDALLATLAPEIIRFEPRLALAGGADGLAAYRTIVPQLPRLLSPRGAAFVEVGAGQATRVAAMLAGHGLNHVDVKTDLAGIGRCLQASAGEPAGQKKKVGNQAGPD